MLPPVLVMALGIAAGVAWGHLTGSYATGIGPIASGMLAIFVVSHVGMRRSVLLFLFYVVVGTAVWLSFPLHGAPRPWLTLPLIPLFAGNLLLAKQRSRDLA